MRFPMSNNIPRPLTTGVRLPRPKWPITVIRWPISVMEVGQSFTCTGNRDSGEFSSVRTLLTRRKSNGGFDYTTERLKNGRWKITRTA